MDFNIIKPRNLLVSIVMLFSFFILFVNPILVFFNYPSLFELIGLNNLNLIAIIGIIIFIFSPICWYLFVNKLSPSEMLNSLNLRSKNIDLAFLWSIFAVVLMSVTTFLFSLFVVFYTAEQNQSFVNLTETVSDISFLTIFIMIIHAVAAEIFFRGFILNKFQSLSGTSISVITTSVLYGIVHLSYGDIYPVILPILFGLILGYAVIKTKNLYSAILAQIFFNVIVFVLNFLALSVS